MNKISRKLNLKYDKKWTQTVISCMANDTCCMSCMAPIVIVWFRYIISSVRILSRSCCALWLMLPVRDSMFNWSRMAMIRGMIWRGSLWLISCSNSSKISEVSNSIRNGGDVTLINLANSLFHWYQSNLYSSTKQTVQPKADSRFTEKYDNTERRETRIGHKNQS